MRRIRTSRRERGRERQRWRRRRRRGWSIPSSPSSLPSEPVPCPRDSRRALLLLPRELALEHPAARGEGGGGRQRRGGARGEARQQGDAARRRPGRVRVFFVLVKAALCQQVEERRRVVPGLDEGGAREQDPQRGARALDEGRESDSRGGDGAVVFAALDPRERGGEGGSSGLKVPCDDAVCFVCVGGGGGSGG